eukprot:28928-Hanusia_phi.AAC.1
MKPILIGIKGNVYDVSKGGGPGGPYAEFAGRDASRMLGKAQVKPGKQEQQQQQQQQQQGQGAGAGACLLYTSDAADDM